MEGNEIRWELNSISALVPIKIMNSFSPQMVSYFSSDSDDPLWSCIVTISTLILLYFPQALKISVLPVLILTVTLLLFLLRLGAIQRLHRKSLEENENEEETRQNSVDIAEKSVLFTNIDKWVAESGFDRNLKLKSGYEQTFIGWDVRAPLEVIYEAYEGEEEGEEKDQDSGPTRSLGLERYPSLSMYYPESDSDTSSDSDYLMTGGWDSPENVCFRWEEEDREGSLIEIALDNHEKKNSDLGFPVEEDNFIEINISPPRREAFSDY